MSVEPAHSRHEEETRTGLPNFVDFYDLLARVGKGAAQIVGLGLLGFAITVCAYLVIKRSAATSTSTRVIFAFKGYERGEYPDRSKFQPDDLRAPEIIIEALKRQGLETADSFQGRIRGSLTVEGIVPPYIVKDRDRLRAVGQPLPQYIPDEYVVTLSLPRDFPLSSRQREILLQEIVSIYREKFRRTYADSPLAFGNALQALHNADFPDYEFVFNEDLQNISAYLIQQIDQSRIFRSPTTNFSFRDLLKQTQIFSQIRLSETLGLIRANGLSRDRTTAILKMGYRLRTLKNREEKAVEEEKVVLALLEKTQSRAQNYVLGIKSQAAAHSDTPVLDQGLVDSLLANDSYSFLVRKALDAGLLVKQIQVEKEQLLEQMKNMESLSQGNAAEPSAPLAQVQKSLADLETAYTDLVSNIRKTQTDFARQQFGDAIRISDRVRTDGIIQNVVVVGIGGLVLGLALGISLSLLGVYIGGGRQTKKAA